MTPTYTYNQSHVTNEFEASHHLGKIVKAWRTLYMSGASHCFLIKPRMIRREDGSWVFQTEIGFDHKRQKFQLAKLSNDYDRKK